MYRGYIRLYRKSLDSAVWQHPNAWRLWCWLLLKATHKPFSAVVGNKTIELRPGQLVTGRKAATSATGLSEQNYRTAIKFLKINKNITIKSTNKYSIITIVNWDSYQNVGHEFNQPCNQQLTSSQPATNHIQEHRIIEKKTNMNEVVHKRKTFSVSVKTAVPPSPEALKMYESDELREILISAGMKTPEDLQRAVNQTKASAHGATSPELFTAKIIDLQGKSDIENIPGAAIGFFKKNIGLPSDQSIQQVTAALKAARKDVL